MRNSIPPSAPENERIATDPICLGLNSWWDILSDNEPASELSHAGSGEVGLNYLRSLRQLTLPSNEAPGSIFRVS